jgi:hypothetical protein
MTWSTILHDRDALDAGIGRSLSAERK